MSREQLAETLRTLGVERAGEAPFRNFERQLEAAFERVGNTLGTLTPEQEQRLRDQFESAWRVETQREAKRLVREAEVRARRDAGVDESWVHAWITVDDDRVCGPCHGRHGEEQTYTEWRRLGLPGSAFCEGWSQCRCDLMPIAPPPSPAPEE